MAKEDFCFTYYDGDAARDVAHMTRLCRGAYHDLVIMQRKTGPMTMAHIKMVLSSDFDTCWPSLEFILKENDDHKYYIDWVEKSVKKGRIHSEKQAKKIQQYWNDVKTGKILRNKKDIPQYKKEEDLNIPLEDGDGYEYNDLERGEGENLLPVGHRMHQEFLEKNRSYPSRPSHDVPAIITIAGFIHQQQTGKQKSLFEMDIGEQEYVFTEWVKWCQWYQTNGNNRSLDTLVKFKLQEIFSEIKNGKKNGIYQQSSNGSNRSLGSKSGGYGILDGIEKKIT